MSDRLVMALAVALVATPRTPLHAQATREADSLLQRVRVLDSVMLERGRAVDSVRRTLVRFLPAVEIRLGPLHVRTQATLESRVRGAVDSVVHLIQRRGGHTFADRAAASVPMITTDSARSVFGMIPIIAIAGDTTRRWSGIVRGHVYGGAHAAEIADALAGVVEQLAMRGADSSLAAWIMLGRAPLRPARAAEAADSYLELVTTESLVLRQCRTRDVSACLDALGIDSMPGSRLTRWYAPEDYRSVVRVAMPAREDSAAVAAWIRCRRELDEAACSIAAHALPVLRVPLPLSASARFSFLREVLDAGGAGSFDRLIGSSGSIRDRLALAANEPLDRTVLRWLDRVERARPDRMHVPPGLVVASLGWTGAILALALFRRHSWV